jgi:hypothetical protein
MDNKSKWKVIASEVSGEFNTEEQADEYKCLCENYEKAHNHNLRSFEVIEYVEDESSCKDCGKTHCDSKCICGACEKCLDSSCKDCGHTLPICACAISDEHGDKELTIAERKRRLK